ncbi:MAG: HD domain-containing protein [Candidatus Aenigmatarchaeota archaeon]
MKRLLELAEQIKDDELRSKVIEVLTKPKLSSKAFDYPMSDPEKMPASLGYHHVYEGGHIDHTYAVTTMATKIADTLREVYKKEIDYDALIAGALVHDIGKLWTMHKPKEWESTGLTLDHTMLGTSELYARNFPEKVLHIVASHFGPAGPTPPQTIEAIIFHFVDSFDANISTSEQADMIKLLMSG